MTVEDRLCAVEADHRALQAAFLDILTRTQRLEVDLERRTFGQAGADLTPHHAPDDDPLFENLTDRCGRRA